MLFVTTISKTIVQQNKNYVIIFYHITTSKMVNFEIWY